MRWLGPVALAACSAGHGGASSTPIDVDVDGYRLHVEVAADPESRERGLAFRRELDDDGGLLLCFPEARPLALDMHDTFLPLTVAFLDGDGRIMGFADMEPFDDVSRYRSSGAAAYALEARQGWFVAHHLEVGAICHFQMPEGLVVR